MFLLFHCVCLLCIIYISSRVREEMNATTFEFLNILTPKLDELFDKELSLEYLNGMNDHLKEYYSDVLDELGIKRNGYEKRIEGK